MIGSQWDANKNDVGIDLVLLCTFGHWKATTRGKSRSIIHFCFCPVQGSASERFRSHLLHDDMNEYSNVKLTIEEKLIIMTYISYDDLNEFFSK